MRGSHMVGDAVDPSPQGAAGIVVQKAPPQLKMDVLDQVPPLVGIGFVGPGEPREWRSVAFRRLPIQGILLRRPGCDVLSSSHIQGSRCEQMFLTPHRKRRNRVCDTEGAIVTGDGSPSSRQTGGCADNTEGQ
jgi:hypothetical protein